MAPPRQFDCVAVITDRRFLFVRTGALVAEGLGFDVAKAMGGLRGPAGPVDYVNAPPEALAAREGTLSIPFVAVGSVSLTKPTMASEAALRIDYRDGQGAARRFTGQLVPTLEQLKQGKNEGRKAKEVRAVIARSVQDALRRHLPPPLVAAGSWEA